MEPCIVSALGSSCITTASESRYRGGEIIKGLNASQQYTEGLKAGAQLRSKVEKSIYEADQIEPNLDCNSVLSIDLAQNGVPFGAKSIGKK